MKIVKAFEDSNVLIKGVTKATEHESKKKTRIFKNVVEYFECYFVRKDFGRYRYSKSRIW